jgi:hypothetical protein
VVFSGQFGSFRVTKRPNIPLIFRTDNICK